MIPQDAKPIYQTFYGSIAHNTITDSSDIDERIVYISDDPSFECFKQRKHNYQIEHWELKAFLNHCKKGVPFELETLYCPKRCWRIPLPNTLQYLIDNNVFVNQVTIKSYLSCSAWKLRQSGMNIKYAYYSIRILLEIQHMLRNHCGPRVDVGDDRDLLIAIKIGNISVDKIKEMYDRLLKEIQQLPINKLPMTADADAIEKSYQQTVALFRQEN